MKESANVRSIAAVQRFRHAVVVFQEEARLCISALEMQLLRIIGWLERDRPQFWKREIENCYREMSEAKVRLHQCRMRKMGDFKPTCFEEKKALDKVRKDLDLAQKQIGVVRYWNTHAQHEANEYHGRASQLTKLVEREVPRLLALLEHSVDRLEAYSHMPFPGASDAFADNKALPEQTAQHKPADDCDAAGESVDRAIPTSRSSSNIKSSPDPES